MVIVVTPLAVNYNGVDNNLLNNIESIEIKNYISFLQWISFYEYINEKFH